MDEQRWEYDSDLNVIRGYGNPPLPPPGYYKLVDGLFEPIRPDEVSDYPIYRIESVSERR